MVRFKVEGQWFYLYVTDIMMGSDRGNVLVNGAFRRVDGSENAISFYADYKPGKYKMGGARPLGAPSGIAAIYKAGWAWIQGLFFSVSTSGDFYHVPIWELVTDIGCYTEDTGKCAVIVQGLEKEGGWTMIKKAANNAAEKIMDKQEKTYTPQEIAERFRVSKDTVWRFIRNGDLKAYKAFGKYVITEEQLNDYINGGSRR